MVFDIVETMNGGGAKCDVLCVSDTSAGFIETDRGYKIVRTPMFGTVSSVPISPTNPLAYRGLHADYNIIHLHAPNPLANLAAMLFPTKAKLVVHWHSDILKPKAQMMIYEPLQKWMLNRADAIVATSENYARSSVPLRDHQHKVHVIPIGADLDDLRPDSGKVLRIKQTYEGRFLVFCLGRLAAYKGFDYIIEAARKLDGCQIMIGGKGPDFRRLHELIEKQGVQDRVALLGGIDHSELASYYAAADVFCLPSHLRTEAYGVVQLEAMALGTPVVSTAIPGSGVGWVNAHEESGLVVAPRSSDQLADAIMRLKNGEALRAALAQGGRERYERLFRHDTMVDKIQNLYQTLTRNG